MTCECLGCLSDWVSSFVPSVKFLADMPATTPYVFELQDAFGNMYYQDVQSGADGSLVLNMSTLPDGFANAGQGSLLVRVKTEKQACSYETMTLGATAEQYDCVELTFRDFSDAAKDWVGCAAAITYGWTWEASDPLPAILAGTYVFNPKGVATLVNIDGDLVADVHLMPARSFAVLRVPAIVTDKTAWFDTGAPTNAGAIPDQVWHAIATQGGFDWYVNSRPMIYDNGADSRLKLTNN